jgi:ketosteroid isomerase-like protein
MSQENVEVVRQVIEAFSRRDAAAMRKLWHPEGEFISLVVALEGNDAVYRASSLEDYMRNLDHVFEEWQVQDVAFTEASADRVVQRHRVSGRGKGSGVPVERWLGIVWTLRDGLIVSGRVFPTPEDALAAAGLSEQDAHADS